MDSAGVQIDLAAAPAPLPEPDIVEESSFNASLMVLLIILWSSCGHLLASRTKYVGEGSAASMFGLIMGLIILVLQNYLTADAVHQLLTFNPIDFFTYLLPPIIFYAGLSVKKKRFFRNIATISCFGIIGTYVAFAVIASVLYGISLLPNILELSDCLALGVIFAATDSVAVLQVLNQDRMPLLYSLVFGEGVINDATSVALLRAVQELGLQAGQGQAQGQLVSSWTIVAVLGKFMYLFAASLALGLMFGLFTSWLMKLFKSNSTPQEVTLLGLLGYLSYLCGDVLGLSGIVSLFCCAVAISHYALHNVNSLSRVTTVSAFQTLSYVSEGAIFIYVGMDALDPIKWTNTYALEVLWLFLVLLLLMCLGRAVFVFPLSWAHNWWSRERLSLRDSVIIWWSGLIRGAVSVALVYYHFDPQGKSEDAKRATLITTTLLVVLFSILVCGALTKPLLQLLLEPQELAAEEPSQGSGSGMGPRHSRMQNGLMYVAMKGSNEDLGSLADDPEQAKEHAFLARISPVSAATAGAQDLRSARDRLFGSKGQDLAAMADNCPPAMVAAAKDGSSAVAGPVVVAVPVEGRSPGPGGGADGLPGQTSGGQAWDDRAANGLSNGASTSGREGQNGLHSRSLSGEGLPGSLLGPGGRRRTSSSQQGGASVPGQGRSRRVSYATPPFLASNAPDPGRSPFETELTAMELGQTGRSDGTDAEEQPLQGRRSSDGRMSRWWADFDSQVMQPVFGGPLQAPPSAATPPSSAAPHT